MCSYFSMKYYQVECVLSQSKVDQEKGEESKVVQRREKNNIEIQ